MRELGKLTADQVDRLDHPVPVTNNGLPVAWLVPLTAGERRRAALIAAGRVRPGRPQGLAGWSPLPPTDSGPTLSELLTEMRDQERT
jgi:antitoxin (DNA-binding transcriptional repressor) of toxin-antitoxin stability system